MAGAWKTSGSKSRVFALFPRRRSAGPAKRRRGKRANTLLFEPDVFHAPAIIGAVDHHRDVLDLRLPAGGLARVIDDRAHPFLDHPALDIPHDPLALFRIGLNRLLVDQRLDLGVAIAGVVARRFTDIALVEDLVGIVDRAA